MPRSHVILGADDLQVGMFVMVHTGDLQKSYQYIPGGAVLSVKTEMYGGIKGVPLAVIAVDLPYVICSIVPGGATRVFDFRDLEFMRVSPAYLAAFQTGRVDEPEQCDDPNCPHCGDCDTGGDAAGEPVPSVN